MEEMPSLTNYHHPYMPNQPLIPGEYYHIYNRGNNGENLFYQEKNFRYFLEKYHVYLSPYLETYAFCLMPNHFHLLVRVKESLADLPGFQNLAGLPKRDPLSQQFSNFFNGYTKAINKQQSRHGSLFEKPFKRKHIDHHAYLQQLVLYIHHNPMHHGFVKNIHDWEWSSYHFVEAKKNAPFTISDETLDWFDGEQQFKKAHQEYTPMADLTDFFLE